MEQNKFHCWIKTAFKIGFLLITWWEENSHNFSICLDQISVVMLGYGGDESVHVHNHVIVWLCFLCCMAIYLAIFLFVVYHYSLSVREQFVLTYLWVRGNIVLETKRLSSRFFWGTWSDTVAIRCEEYWMPKGWIKWKVISEDWELEKKI